MPIDPITLSLLVGTAGQAASALPDLIPSKTEREQKKELEELKRREEAGALGLSSKETDILTRRLSGAGQIAAQQAEAERNRLLAGQGATTGGQALQAAIATEEQARRAQERIATEVAAQDLAEKMREEEKMSALTAAQSDATQRRLAAVGAIGGAALEAGVTTAAQQKLIQGSRAPSPEAVSGLAASLGVSDDEARGFIELSVENPELMQYLTLMRGQ